MMLSRAFFWRDLAGIIFLAYGFYVSPLAAQTPGAPASEDLPRDLRITPERPGDDRRDEFPEIPLREKSPPQFTLPPIPTPSDKQLSSQLRVFVKKVNLTGNTVFSNEELAKVVIPYKDREITSEELQSLRNELTLYYVNNGYINSGAVIPDQNVVDGDIEINVVEGKLTEVDVAGNDWLRPHYVRDRVKLGSEDILNLSRLQDRIKLLQQDRLIDRVNAELRPGLQPGDSILRVLVEESRPYELGVVFDNHRSPSVGELQGQVYGSISNLAGIGDTLSGRFSLTDGLNNVFASYSFPFNAYDSRFKFYFDQTDADVVEDPFDDIEIRSETETFGLSLSHPFVYTPESQLLGTLTLEKRRSKTFLLDRKSSFSEGPINGVSNVTVLRFLNEWVNRSPNQVLALRSTLSWGIDAFGATNNKGKGNAADARFFAWLGQFQWVRRLWDTDNQVLIRTDVQLTPHPLLPLEKFAVGGANSVRGYRENQLVRDNGAVASIEFRFPVFTLPIPGISKGPADGRVQFATFYDFGWSKNENGASPNPRNVSSTGIGLRWDPHPKIHSEFYWANPFRNVDNGGEQSLQDSGIHFSLNMQLL